MSSAASQPEGERGTGVSVVPLVPVWRVDRRFDYALPAKLQDAVQVGSLVRVPFGNRRVRAVVTSLVPTAAEGLEEVAALVAGAPVAPGRLIEVFEWLAQRYVAPLGRAFERAVPPRVRMEVASPEPLDTAPPEPSGDCSRIQVERSSSRAAARGRVELVRAHALGRGSRDSRRRDDRSGPERGRPSPGGCSRGALGLGDSRAAELALATDGQGRLGSTRRRSSAGLAANRSGSSPGGRRSIGGAGARGSVEAHRGRRRAPCLLQGGPVASLRCAQSHARESSPAGRFLRLRQPDSLGRSRCGCA